MTSTGLPVRSASIRVKCITRPKKKISTDLYVTALTLRAAGRLVDHDLAVGKGKSFSLGPGSKKERAHARRHSYADGRDVTLHELHRVVYRHAGRYRSAGAVDIK